MVRWTLPALLLTWVVGGYVVAAAGRSADGANPALRRGRRLEIEP
jgi:hypothetical protein